MFGCCQGWRKTTIIKALWRTLGAAPLAAKRTTWTNSQQLPLNLGPWDASGLRVREAANSCQAESFPSCWNVCSPNKRKDSVSFRGLGKWLFSKSLAISNSTMKNSNQMTQALPLSRPNSSKHNSKRRKGVSQPPRHYRVQRQERPSSPCFSPFILCFETLVSSHKVTQTGLKLWILLPQASERHHTCPYLNQWCYLHFKGGLPSFSNWPLCLWSFCRVPQATDVQSVVKCKYTHCFQSSY